MAIPQAKWRCFAPALLLPLLCCALTVSARAAAGDIAGTYYSTDIRTYLNDFEIEAVNIGGRTLIKAEDMAYYSFRVLWSAESRELNIWEEAHPLNGPVPKVSHSAGTAGEPLGFYYETDIVTYLDNHAVEAYNTGGVTYLCAEDLRDCGYEVVWDAQKRELRVTSPMRAGCVYSVFLSRGHSLAADDPMYENGGFGAVSVESRGGALTGRGDARLTDASLHYDGREYTVLLSWYQNEGLFYAGNLLRLLGSVSTEEYGETPPDLPARLAKLRETVRLRLNGMEAEVTGVSHFGGNGHRDFRLTFDGPRLREADLRDISFSVGGADSLEAYPIVNDDPRLGFNQAVEAMCRTPEDFMQTAYYMEHSALVYMKHAVGWGSYTDALYLLDTDSWTWSGEDLLDAVRGIDGFNVNNVHPSSFRSADDGRCVVFSCAVDGHTAEFLFNPDDNTVRLISSLP